MSALEELSFKITLLDKDFLLHTGVPSHRLSEDIIRRITKCKGEYLPTQKGFRIPHSELCNLLDECFDYFTEESLLEIASLLDKSGADATTKERVREKSVSKSHHRLRKDKSLEEDKPKKSVDEDKPKKSVDEDKPKKSLEENKRMEIERKNKELEQRLLELEQRREEERREFVRVQERRRNEESRREDELRTGVLRMKTSPSRFRVPENLYTVKPLRKVNFDSGKEDENREILSMMSSLRTSMNEMKSNMSRLEQMISRRF